jgi:hypothetical protein
MSHRPRTRATQAAAREQARIDADRRLDNDIRARVRDAVARALLAEPEAGQAAAEERAAASLCYPVTFVRGCLGVLS